MDIVAGRPLGTMITYGFPEQELEAELELALGIGASVLEILPDWSRFPDPDAGPQAVSRSRSVDPQCPRLLGRADHSRTARRPGIEPIHRSAANRSTT